VTDVMSMTDVLRGADQTLRSGGTPAGAVWPTGFEPLDTYLGGGFRSRELTLIAGPQGLGKTTFVTQILRHQVHSGRPGLMFSFEHDATTMLERFVALEAGLIAGIDAVPLRRIREAMETVEGGSGLADRLAGTAGGQEALDQVNRYGDLLFLHRSSGVSTTLAIIEAEARDVAARTGTPPMIIVDYLQKVAVDGTGLTSLDVSEEIVEGLKDMSLTLDAPVVAIVASDLEGTREGQRMRLHHMRGSSALAYEADVVLVMNQKFDVVARHHLVYNTANAERYRDWVVVSVEKNRTGLDRIDLEFRKRFEQSRFDPEGAAVEEQLVDERVFVE
jgi:replicative DNA helicase